MTANYTFPFGEPVNTLAQQDSSPKKIFILGVYASAVHARWIAPDGKSTIVGALAVASEPYIFWRGEDAAKYIPTIDPKHGTLTPAPKNLNGPSGIALDNLFLKPLGISREDAWLCDIVPHSCRNQGQANAIREKYAPLAEKHGLPEATTPAVPDFLCDDKRRGEILRELQKSMATTLVLLGDQPIKWFLHHFDSRWNSLADFGTTPDTYGKRHAVTIGRQEYDVIPLVHPRQASALGAHSEKWKRLHEGWVLKPKA